MSLPTGSFSYSCSSSSSSSRAPVLYEQEDVEMEECPPNSPEIIGRSYPSSTFLTPNTNSYSCSSSSSSSSSSRAPVLHEREDVGMEECPPNSPEIISRSYPPSAFLTPNTKKVLICPLDRTPEGRFQFNGFREIREVLIRLQQEGKARGIKDEEIAALKDLIRSKNIEDPRERLILLKLLSEHFFFGVDEIFHEILNGLQHEIPRINQYMETVPDIASFGPVLTPEGVQEILNFYERHCNFPEGVLSCLSVSELNGAVAEMKGDYQENAIRGWAVFNEDFEDDRHIVPVFAICKGGKVHVFIFDSQGHTFDSRCKPIMSQSLRKLLMMFGREDIELYSYRDRRQSGQVECSIYTILDLKNLVEMHMGNPEKTIVDFYQENPDACSRIESLNGVTNRGAPPYEITRLIPAMMKPTQSLSRLERESKMPLRSPIYSVKRRLFGGDIVEKEQDPMMLQKEIESYSTYSQGSDGRLQNSYIAQHRLEYFIYLLTSILEPKQRRQMSPYREPL